MGDAVLAAVADYLEGDEAQVASVAAQEVAPEGADDARQAKALCPYCNGTGEAQQMAASAGTAVNSDSYEFGGSYTFEVATGTAVKPGIEELHVTGALTAAAAGLVPVTPPADWFAVPEPNAPTALTITADGQVYGHAALWNTCHTGHPGCCTVAPRSRSN